MKKKKSQFLNLANVDSSKHLNFLRIFQKLSDDAEKINLPDNVV